MTTIDCTPNSPGEPQCVLFTTVPPPCSSIILRISAMEKPPRPGALSKPVKEKPIPANTLVFTIADEEDDEGEDNSFTIVPLVEDEGDAAFAGMSTKAGFGT